MAGARDNRVVSASLTIPGIPAGRTPTPSSSPLNITLSTQTINGIKKTVTFGGIQPGETYSFDGAMTHVSLTVSSTTPPSLGGPIEPPASSLLIIHQTIPEEFQNELLIGDGDVDPDPRANTQPHHLPATPSSTPPVSGFLDPSDLLHIDKTIPEEHQPHLAINLGDGDYEPINQPGRRLEPPVGSDAYFIPISSGGPKDIESQLDEESPLLGSKKQGWCSWAGSGIGHYTYRYTVAPVINGAIYAKEHPYVSATAVLTAVTPAVNALAMVAKISPAMLGKEWWNNMSNLERAHSLANCVSSFSINAIMNALFLTTAWDEFKKNISHTFDGVPEFIDSVLPLLLAIGGAIAQAAIAYNSFLFLPAGVVTAAAPSFISFMVTLASRYIGVKNIFKQIHNIFNEDAKTQAEFADALDHIDEKYLNELQHEYSKIITSIPELRKTARETFPTEFRRKLTEKRGYVEGEPLTSKEQQELDEALKEFADDAPISNKEYEYIENQISEILTQMLAKHPDLVKDKTTREYLTKYGLTFFKVSFAFTLVAAPYFLTFMQKGYDGVATIARFAGSDIHSISAWLKRLIGLAPGLASGALAFNSATQLPETVVNFIKHLYHTPSDIPFAIPIVVADGFSAAGPQNVALGVVQNKDNVTGFHDGKSLAQVFVDLNAGAGAIINGNAAIKKAFLSGKPNPKTVQLTDVKAHVRNVDSHLVHHDTTDSFRDFLGNLKQRKHITVADAVDMRRNESTFFPVN